jgi:hypothetical protein
LALLLAACDQPPTRELGAAESALADARSQGADVFAAERFKEAEAALASARQKADQKDYRGALSSAVDAAEKAKAAAAGVPSAKVLLRSGAETVQAEAQAALDEAAGIREEAKKGRVPEAAFEALVSRTAEVEAGLKTLAGLLEQGELIEAQKAGAELKARAAGLAADYRAALDKWNEEHPRSRRPAKRR